MNKEINKIMIIGCCGAGKSTLSFKLKEHFKLPLYHLDRLFWKPGWIQAERNDYIAKHQEIIEKPQWIIDGNYSFTMPDRLEKADLIICMDLPRWLCIWGIFKRRIQYRNKSRPDMTTGCNERLEWEFTKYVWNFHRDQRPKLMEHLADIKGQKPIHILTSRKQTARLLDAIVHDSNEPHQ
ncbi:MAG: DNA topology modulation protein [Akkermansiaceae bacterium]